MLVVGAAVLLLVLGAGGGEKRSIGEAQPATRPSIPRASAPARSHGPGIVARENHAIDRILGYTPFVTRGKPREREVALTFDDGPGPYTPKILRILRHRHAHATFFEVGRMLEWFAPNTRRAIRDGNAIGDHTLSHAHMAQLPAANQRTELLDASSALQAAGARPPRLFRPPYGSFDQETLDVLKSERVLMVLWSTDTEDYTDPGVSAIARTALAGARPGTIILLHDGGGDRSQTAAALPGIIKGIRARGLKLVTVPKLLLDDAPPHGQRIPWELGGSGS